jgi:hypothetical protein
MGEAARITLIEADHADRAEDNPSGRRGTNYILAYLPLDPRSSVTIRGNPR